MSRRLDKIEKEMGYCDVKLEKERRLRGQIALLEREIGGLDRLIEQHSALEARPAPRGAEAGRLRRPAREEFRAAGLLEVIREEREILDREREELVARLGTFSGFDQKRSVLEAEKRIALRDLAPAHSAKMRRMDEGFRKVEKQWNLATEDIINLDAGLACLERNLDYLRSCRTFLIAARGGFDIDDWLAGGYLCDLFRHSTIGRAKEMADGADRNVKLAMKELVCVAGLRLRPGAFARVLLVLLDALYQDIYTEGKLQLSLQVVEAALAGNLKLTEEVRERREQLAGRIEAIEKLRGQLFLKLGGERRSRMVG